MWLAHVEVDYGANFSTTLFKTAAIAKAEAVEMAGIEEKPTWRETADGWVAEREYEYVLTVAKMRIED